MNALSRAMSADFIHKSQRNVTVYALAAFASFPTIERVGRRNLFLIGSAGQALSMFIIMACLIQNDPNIIKGAVFGLFLYLIFFGFTWLELPWLYPAEVREHNPGKIIRLVVILF